MSQEKVDRYKDQKQHRKEIMKRKKIQSILWKVGAAVVLLAIIVWLGSSAYRKYEASVPRTEVEINVSSLTEYTSSIPTQEEAESADVSSTEEENTEETSESESTEGETSDEETEAAE